MTSKDKPRLVKLGTVTRSTRAVRTIGSPEFANPNLQYNG